VELEEKKLLGHAEERGRSLLKGLTESSTMKDVPGKGTKREAKQGGRDIKPENRIEGRSGHAG